MKCFKTRQVIVYVSFMIFISAFPIHGVPPHPRLYSRSFMEDSQSPIKSIDIEKFKDPDFVKIGYKPQPDGIEYILALRVDFSDQPGKKPASVFNDAIFGSNGTSMKLYFEEVSYQKMHISPGYLGGVMPPGDRWYRARKPMSYYGSGNIMSERYEELAIDVCKMADADVDFSRYDRDGDGYVDHFMLIHSGNDEASTGIDNDIWSAVIERVDGVYDGVRISTAMILAEDPGNDFINIGIYCHEFFHEFGAPDLYQFSWNYPVGEWCLMGRFGPYQDEGRHPGHISGYLKWDFDADPSNGISGWVTPESLVSPGIYTINSFELPKGNRLYRVDIGGKGGKEYFLLENRNNKAPGAIYDTYLPDSGIVIWHIDERQPPFYSEPSRVWVEDPSDPERKNFRKATKGAAYSSNDGQISFTPFTIPNSNANDGTYSGIFITDIGNRGDEMTFNLYFKDTYEPNDTMESAYGPIIYGIEYNSFITSEKDIDFYKIYAKDGNSIYIYLENIPKNCNYDLQVLDDNNKIVAISNKSGNSPEVVNIKIQRPGLYYIVVSSQYGFSQNQQYSLVAKISPMAPGLITSSKIYPNPGPDKEGFIHFDYELLKYADTITLNIYTIFGELIYAYSNEVTSKRGRFSWDTKNGSYSKRNVASGIYIYVIEAKTDEENYKKTGKLSITRYK